MITVTDALGDIVETLRRSSQLAPRWTPADVSLDRKTHRAHVGERAWKVALMVNDDLEILSCGIPMLATRLASRRIQRLADYPLAIASEWAPHPAEPVAFSGGADDSDELTE